MEASAGVRDPNSAGIGLSTVAKAPREMSEAEMRASDSRGLNEQWADQLRREVVDLDAEIAALEETIYARRSRRDAAAAAAEHLASAMKAEQPSRG